MELNGLGNGETAVRGEHMKIYQEGARWAQCQRKRQSKKRQLSESSLSIIPTSGIFLQTTKVPRWKKP